MKRIIISLLILGTLPAQAISIKEKIVKLRKALAAHAQSETDSNEAIENLDQRVRRMESGLAPCPISSDYEEKSTKVPMVKKRKYKSHRPGLTQLSKHKKDKKKNKNSKPIKHLPSCKFYKKCGC